MGEVICNTALPKEELYLDQKSLRKKEHSIEKWGDTQMANKHKEAFSVIRLQENAN